MTTKQEHQQVGQTIVAQIGNWTLASVGARDLMLLEGDGGLSFAVGSKSGRLRKIRIEYVRSRDLYRITGWSVDKRTLDGMNDPVVSLDDVYADMLSEIVVTVARRLGVRC